MFPLAIGLLLLVGCSDKGTNESSLSSGAVSSSSSSTTPIPVTGLTFHNLPVAMVTVSDEWITDTLGVTLGKPDTVIYALVAKPGTIYELLNKEFVDSAGMGDISVRAFNRAGTIISLDYLYTNTVYVDSNVTDTIFFQCVRYVSTPGWFQVFISQRSFATKIGTWKNYPLWELPLDNQYRVGILDSISNQQAFYLIHTQPGDKIHVSFTRSGIQGTLAYIINQIRDGSDKLLTNSSYSYGPYTDSSDLYVTAPDSVLYVGLAVRDVFGSPEYGTYSLRAQIVPIKVKVYHQIFVDSGEVDGSLPVTQPDTFYYDAQVSPGSAYKVSFWEAGTYDRTGAGIFQDANIQLTICLGGHLSTDCSIYENTWEVVDTLLATSDSLTIKAAISPGAYETVNNGNFGVAVSKY